MLSPSNAISAQGLGDCTAEARSKEFLINTYSELCELCTTMLLKFLRSRKFLTALIIRRNAIYKTAQSPLSSLPREPGEM